MISIRKRGSVYQYCFVAGQKAYDEFINGESTTECNMLYFHVAVVRNIRIVVVNSL